MATDFKRVEDRQARLAAALRENLRRRKQQVRARAVPAHDPADPQPIDPPPSSTGRPEA